MAAGFVLLKEAGGLATDYQGSPYILGLSRDVLGSNGRLHELIMGYLKAPPGEGGKADGPAF